MLPEVYGLIGLLLSSVLLSVALWVLNRRVSGVAAQLTRTAEVHAEAGRMKQANDRLAAWQEVTEASIDGGTKAVRAVHKGIAAIPFSILESIPATRDTAKIVRGIHDFTSDNVYAAISTVNRLAGERSRSYLQPKAPVPEVISHTEPARIKPPLPDAD